MENVMERGDMSIEFTTDAFLDAFPDAVLFCNSDGIIQKCNANVCSLLGYAVDELEGQPV
jgi:PAS domain S-box-containing protein